MRDAAELIIKRRDLDIRIVPCADQREYDELLRKKEFDVIFDAGSDYSAAERNSRHLSGLKALKVNVDDFLLFDNPVELIRAVHDGTADVGYLSTRTLDEALSRDSELQFAT